MLERTVLEQVHITNFLSLRDVCLPLKQLTVLVGPNASGKSNILRALGLLRTMMFASEPPSADYIQDMIWAGGADNIGYRLETTVDQTPAVYKLELKPVTDNQIAFEELTVDTLEVISIQDGRGKVRDEEDHTQVTPYRPPKPRLALKSAGDYGDRPVTSALTEFVQNWKFYNFKPAAMRRGAAIVQIVKSRLDDLPEAIDSIGSDLGILLFDWSENDTERFQSVNEALENCVKLGIELGQRGHNGEYELGLQEGYKDVIPLNRASDGTLRFAAYQVLLHQPEIPSLIAIEEPERNLHPAALKDIASLLEQLAERTQVIITTHSSQLLDAFNPDNLSDNLGVLLLQNIPGKGTKIVDLDEARKDQTALEGWIADFGIGSAIFDSELVQEPLEGEPCQE